MSTMIEQVDPPSPVDRLREPIKRLIHMENISGIALIAGAVVAVVLATSPLAGAAERFWETHLAIRVGSIELNESLLDWVNDALMTIFFLVAGLEIKRELVTGDLRNPRQAALPVAAAAGGMVIPAALFFALSRGTDFSGGWGIPMATDIAFAVGILTLLGDRVPTKLKMFLLTLAIVDDLGAILVIAIFYSSSLNLTYLGFAALGLASMALLKQLGIWWTPIYVIIGIGVWLATFESGVHATLAGVACGLLAPAVPRRPGRTSGNAHPDSTVEELKSIIFDTRETRSVADRLINQLHPWSALIIIPLFALGNAGVSVAPSAIAEGAGSVVFRAVVVGLVIGKPVGIVGACFLAVKSGLAVLPRGVNWKHMLGIGFLGGIGFTVSIFISGLAYDSEEVVGNSKIAILLASVAASLLGAVILSKAGIVVEEDSTQPGPAHSGTAQPRRSHSDETVTGETKANVEAMKRSRSKESQAVKPGA